MYIFFRLRQLDIAALKNLQGVVNVIPVIAKADTLTPVEVRKLKDQVLEDLRSNHIQVNKSIFYLNSDRYILLFV